MSKADPDVSNEKRGIVLLALLIALALAGIFLSLAVDVWSMSRQRERERDLLFVGEQYRQAIQRYYLAAPAGSGRVLPANFEVLLNDDRYPTPVHHLRRAYPDPITGTADWGTVRIDDRIIGVHSLSEAEPLKQAGFAPAYRHFSEAKTYSDWIFQFRVPGGRLAAPSAAASSPMDDRIPAPSTPTRRRKP